MALPSPGNSRDFSGPCSFSLNLLYKWKSNEFGRLIDINVKEMIRHYTCLCLQFRSCMRLSCCSLNLFLFFGSMAWCFCTYTFAYRPWNPCETTNILIVSIQSGDLIPISAWFCDLDRLHWWTLLGPGNFLSELIPTFGSSTSCI